jgi:hypothetical protein
MMIVSIVPHPCTDLPLVNDGAARRRQYQSREYTVDRPMNGTTFLASFEEILEVFFGAGCEDDGAVQLASSISFLTLVKTFVLYQPKWWETEAHAVPSWL